MSPRRHQPARGHGAVFGWTAEDDLFLPRDRVGAGFGGMITSEPAEFGSRARIALAADPVGARFGLWQGRDLPDLDFTFLRRPDGHEVAGIMGVPGPAESAWATAFEVADTDETIARVVAAGGRSTEPEDFVYGRMATVTDPFGLEFGVIARP